MSHYKNINISYSWINIGKIVEKIYETLEDEDKAKVKDDKELKNEKNNNTISHIENKEFINKDDNIKEVKISKDNPIESLAQEILGVPTYIILDKEIKILFSKKAEPLFILKKPILFVLEKSDGEGTLIYTKTHLNKALNDFGKSYEFIVNSNLIKDKNLILDDLPAKIVLREKLKEIGINFEIFEQLNHKKEIPKDDYIPIVTNELIPQNILSLGIYRDNKINIVLKNRNKLINEIKNFMDNENERIMRIFGVDGIGKSLTCIYLTSLKNNFKTIYFNLKEFFDYTDVNITNLFKSQLTNYYTNEFDEGNVINTNEDKKIYEYKFGLYEDSMKNFEQDIQNKNIIDFWGLLAHILEKYSGNSIYKLLCIIDQYKLKYDEQQKLFALERKILGNIKMVNIKFLVISSLNDSGVKEDFIELLNRCSKKVLKENLTIIEPHNIEDVSLNKEEEDIFEEFSDNINYLEEDEKQNDNFEKIKLFNEIKDENSEEIHKEEKSRLQSNEYIILDKIEKYRLDYLNKNKYNFDIDDKYRIIYINDLISIEPIESFEEEKFRQIIPKLSNFNYNPKYYNQIKNNFKKNKNIKNIEEIYHDFIIETYNKINSKIKGFYKDFNKKINNTLTDSDIAVILLQLIKLIDEKIELDLNSLIFYLNKFPLKYLKIISINKEKSNSFLKLDKKISDSRFRIEYSFPFIKFIISRMLFELGKNKAIHYSDISGSGMGSFLEKIIRKALLLDKIYGDFNSRYVWALKRFITPRQGKNETKEEDKIEKGLNIDFFNLEVLKYDDETKNPLTNYYSPYYIIPDSQTNPIIDSIILLPCMLENSIHKTFDSLSLQITVNKKNIYSLEEYHKASTSASELTENIYDIKIRDKYFVFVLEKDYDNKTTIDKLITSNIPFIYFSSSENLFYSNKEEQIANIYSLLDNKFLIGNEEEDQSLFKKEMVYLQMENLLKKKRKRDNMKITKNLFGFIRKKLFKNEKPLILTEDIYKKVIEQLKTNSYYKNKNILIEYIFITKFSECNELLKSKSNFLGLVFYKSLIILLNSKFEKFIKIINMDKNSKQD